jgi:protein-S-isoprenylcysteine O-methyltransferase Ste14
MTTDSAHHSNWQIGEVVFGVPFLLALALQLIVPFSLFGGKFRFAFIVVGLALVTLGVRLIALARRELARHSQPTDPGHPTTRIVTTGVFSISRNPIYLGAVCFLAGIALGVNLPWVLVLLLPGVVLCHYILIAPEERYLSTRFGEEYRAYKATVHRWIGRGSQL